MLPGKHDRKGAWDDVQATALVKGCLMTPFRLSRQICSIDKKKDFIEVIKM